MASLLSLCVGCSPVTGEFPSQRPVKRSFDVFFDLRLNKRLNKRSWRRWFETPSRSLWRHCNAASTLHEIWWIDVGIDAMVTLNVFPGINVSMHTAPQNRCWMHAFINTFWVTLYKHLIPQSLDTMCDAFLFSVAIVVVATVLFPILERCIPSSL